MNFKLNIILNIIIIGSSNGNHLLVPLSSSTMAHSPLSAFTSHHTTASAIVDAHHHGYATVQPNVQAHNHLSSKQRYAELLREAAQINDPQMSLNKHRDQGMNLL